MCAKSSVSNIFLHISQNSLQYKSAPDESALLLALRYTATAFILSRT